MRILSHLFENNRKWAEENHEAFPAFFKIQEEKQTPKYLWIGCSDSRVPAEDVVGLPPGELFVHRNIANQVSQADTNCLSVLQYAVQYLQIKHVIVCGHYGCGGIQAALNDFPDGSLNDWLKPIRSNTSKHRDELEQCPDQTAVLRKMCELNVIEQVIQVAHTSIVQNAWEQENHVAIHGWVYEMGDGLLKDLEVTVASNTELQQIM